MAPRSRSTPRRLMPAPKPAGRGRAQPAPAPAPLPPPPVVEPPPPQPQPQPQQRPRPRAPSWTATVALSDEPAPGGIGQPGLVDDDRKLALFWSALAGGNSIDDAAFGADSSPASVFRALRHAVAAERAVRHDPEHVVTNREQRYRDFRNRTRQVMALVKVKIVKDLHAEPDWHCKLKILERRYPEEWGVPRRGEDSPYADAPDPGEYGGPMRLAAVLKDRRSKPRAMHADDSDDEPYQPAAANLAGGLHDTTNGNGTNGSGNGTGGTNGSHA